MSHLAIVLLTVGAFVLILGTIRAVRAYLENRSEEMAPFRNYFGAEYDRAQPCRPGAAGGCERDRDRRRSRDDYGGADQREHLSLRNRANGTMK